MELEIDLITNGNNATKVGVVQSGYQYGDDWDCYYDVAVEAWPQVLELFKQYLESSES